MFFKRIPFLRLFIALCAGIIAAWYLRISLPVILAYIGALALLLISFAIMPMPKKFIYGWAGGLLWLMLFCGAGMLFLFNQDVTNRADWYGKYYKPGDAVLLTVLEPLEEKPKSYKALAEISAVFNNARIPVKGRVLLYFKKDSIKPALYYGSQIISNASLQAIQSSGNPATFDYRRYCLFKGITSQAFLAANDYHILSSKNKNVLQFFLFAIRDKALQTLRLSIHAPQELGIAEALLIGYRNDLDKDLVQAYSNTGVVHIIAISGLHLAMIYAGLLRLFSLLRLSHSKKWIESVVVLTVIWLFTLIAGAAPSVLRAAIMFTFILFGKFIGKNTNIYNTLAASAFVLLLINPFYLWDVGFQLSYTAVLGILVFFKPVRKLLYFKNKTVRWVWDLCAVSLCAQVFTLPLVIYHFHQLPLLFLFSNLVVVPLSSLVLIAELALFLFSWAPIVASCIGKITGALIWLMNVFTLHIDKLPFSVWEGLHISLLQLLALFAAIIFITLWLFTKRSKNMVMVLLYMLVFFVLRDVNLLRHKAQQKLIVYNIPKYRAVDLIAGENCRFFGDTAVIKDVFLRNYNIKPARIKNGLYASKEILLPDISNIIIKTGALRVLVLGEQAFKEKSLHKINVDVIILSRGATIAPSQLHALFNCRYIVADSSVPSWKFSKWKKEFEQLHLRFYSVQEQGAFILNL
ncbi:ComEC/Rec2 family competence protein [Parafilimonas sp.]|uniref:ComEC/Rec2 family competence protein n=1 Tax=Parafilimonas sp. TaxID=1969739 RepID=UPI0039E69FC7